MSGPSPRRLTHTTILPYHPATVFRAIQDISAYHGFLTLVSSSVVMSKDNHGSPKTAKLKVGYPSLGIEEEWQCHTKFDRTAGTSEVKCRPEGGVLEHWSMSWTIKPPPTESAQRGAKSTTVELVIELKFRSFLYDQMFAVLPGNIPEKLIVRFERRMVQVDEEERKERVKKMKEKAKAEAAKKETAKKSEVASKGTPRKLEVRSAKPGSGGQAASSTAKSAAA